MKAIWILILLAIAPAKFSQAADTSGHWTRAKLALLAQARSRKELMHLKALIVEREEASEACLLQLEWRRLPTTCFRRLEIDQRLGVLKKGQVIDEIRRLEDACLASDIDMTLGAAPESRNWKSSRCYQRWMALKAVRDYKSRPRSGTWSGI